MTDYPTIRAHFDRLRAAPKADRDRELDAIGPADDPIRVEVESLLRSSGAWPALETPVVASAAAIADSAAQHDPMPAARIAIPGYVCRDLLGEGGMGLVYRAEQTSPRRDVALKVLRPGLAAGAVLRRFQLESDLLARLDHPGIARVYQTGTHSTFGSPQPFFAMELVRGKPLLEHAESNSLDEHARIGLLIELCDAVGHAHQRGVIHRDLKPSNIMVDEAGRVKVLDFGVARTLEADTQLATMHTSTGALVGTLAYMSPEQLEGDPSDIDTRSDIYSIGAIAYELLSGTPAHNLSGRSVPDAILAVREGVPAPLASIAPGVDADLATVVTKALAAEPALRYPAASALAADLARVVRNEPIEARPPSWTYRARKFARRNTLVVVAMGVVVLAVGAGVTAISVSLAQAIAAQQRVRASAEVAEREAAASQAINDFLRDDLLSAVDPARTDDRDVTMRSVVDEASARIGGQFEDQPLVEASIRETLANVYERLGEAGAAEPHRLRAVDLRSIHEGPRASSTLNARANLSTTYMEQGRYVDAIDTLNDTLEAIDAAAEDGEAIDEALRVRLVSNLAVAHLQVGDLDRAAPLLAESLDAKRADLGDRHPSTLTSINNLGGLYIALGRPADAEPLYREAAEGRRAVLGEADPRTMTAVSGLAWCLTDLGRYDEARELLEGVHAIADARLDRAHPVRAQILNSLGNTATKAGRFAEAERWFRESVELRREQFGPDGLQTMMSLGNVGDVLLELERAEEARALFADLVERADLHAPPNHSMRGTARVGLGRAFVLLGDHVTAERHLLDGTCLLAAAMGQNHPRPASAFERLVALYRTDGSLPGAAAGLAAAERGDGPGSLCETR